MNPILTAKHVKLALFYSLFLLLLNTRGVVGGVGVATKANGSWQHFKAWNLGALQPRDLFTLAVQEFSTSVTVADDWVVRWNFINSNWLRLSQKKVEKVERNVMQDACS